MASDPQTAEGVDDWRVLGDRVSAWFEAPSHTAGAALVARIAALVGGSALPDLDLRAHGVRVRIGPQDTPIATAVSAAARDLGLTAAASALQVLQLAIDVADPPAVSSFWETTLGYEPAGADQLRDPARRDPVVSFRRRDVVPPQRNRIHMDVSRTSDAVDAARTAVGQQPFGPYGLRLADAEGNEIDLVPGDRLGGGSETSDWWTVFGAMTAYPTSSTAQTSELVTAIAGLADDAGVPLMIDVRGDVVTVDSGKDAWEGDDGSPDTRFADLARQVQTTARNLELSADPSRLHFVQLCIDAVDVPAVRAFWVSLLGFEHDSRDVLTDIVDPRRLNPVIMFQHMEAADGELRRRRNRIHVELVVPHDRLQARIDTALGAGGRVIADPASGPCTIADPEGIEIDLVSTAPEAARPEGPNRL